MIKIINSLLLIIAFSISVQAQSYCKSLKEHRKEYKANFDKDERAPIKGDELKFMNFYKAQKKYVVECSVELTPDDLPFEMPTYSGITKPFKKYAILNFEIKGEKYSLAAYQNLKILAMPIYKDHLFIPFKDLSNDDATYGGGRYIDMKTSDITNGTMKLDFNKAYNPWCAYSDGYNCPIPPFENHLDVILSAGEKMYKGPKKKATH